MNDDFELMCDSGNVFRDFGRVNASGHWFSSWDTKIYKNQGLW